MKIAVVNASRAKSADIHTVCQAVTWSLCNAFAQHWGFDGRVMKVAPAKDLASIPVDAWPCLIADRAEQAGILGYHSLTPDGRPYLRVFLDACTANGESVLDGIGATLDHEAKETRLDEGANRWADAGDGYEHAIEACDACEDGTVPVRVGDRHVLVSNHVRPAYFNPGAAGPFDWLGKIEAPFTRTSGGYSIVRFSGIGETSAWGRRFGDLPPKGTPGSPEETAAAVEKVKAAGYAGEGIAERMVTEWGPAHILAARPEAPRSRVMVVGNIPPHKFASKLHAASRTSRRGVRLGGALDEAKAAHDLIAAAHHEI